MGAIPGSTPSPTRRIVPAATLASGAFSFPVVGGASLKLLFQSVVEFQHLIFGLGLAPKDVILQFRVKFSGITPEVVFYPNHPKGVSRKGVPPPRHEFVQ